MAHPNALVDLVSNLSSPVEAVAAAPLGPRYMRIAFQGGQAGLLDMSIPRSVVWAEVLDSLRRANAPAYVEIDPATNVITNLLAPLMVRVAAITPTAEGDAMEVELVISHARHYLRRTNPDFDQLLHALQTARDQGMPVAVTETSTEHEIIDVRFLPHPAGEETRLAPPPATEGPSLAAAVTPAQAQQLFNLVNAKVCCPATAAAPCIPFTYPDDGCWGRAHEMCRLMITAGMQPEKIWIYGSLRAATQNNPRCEVRWGWHVAPTLSVNIGAGSQVWVIDPSLFPDPVPQAAWASVQGDPHPTLIPSPASVFYRNQSGSVSETDPTYTKTNQVLNTYRNQLRLRAVGPDGPPPYLQCLPARPGVQWYGTIAAGATHSWFTYGWPASWHVLWTVMPLTACPGAPQLSWKVRVERANATQATYWIVVKNLTSNIVRFEGRYDILSR